jgi:hypothetical protein
MESMRSVSWLLAVLGTCALLAFNAPAGICLVAAVVLAAGWCREMERDTGSRAGVPGGSIGDDRHLHIAGEADDPLNEAAAKQA